MFSAVTLKTKLTFWFALNVRLLNDGFEVEYNSHAGRVVIISTHVATLLPRFE